MGAGLFKLQVLGGARKVTGPRTGHAVVCGQKSPLGWVGAPCKLMKSPSFKSEACLHLFQGVHPNFGQG